MSHFTLEFTKSFFPTIEIPHLLNGEDDIPADLLAAILKCTVLTTKIPGISEMYTCLSDSAGDVNEEAQPSCYSLSDIAADYGNEMVAVSYAVEEIHSAIMRDHNHKWTFTHELKFSNGKHQLTLSIGYSDEYWLV